MKANIRTILILAALGATTMNGCATEPTAVEAAFGNSARQMVIAQTYDPAAADEPIVAAPLNGEYGVNVLDEYRVDVAKKEAVCNDIVFNIGE